MSQLEKFQALKRQMPLLELTDTLTGELVEPFPAKAAQWLKLSKTLLLISIGLLLAGGAFAAFAAKNVVTAKKVLATGEIRNAADLRKAQRTAKALREIGVPKILERGNIMTRLSSALKNLPAWQIKVEPQQSVTVAFSTDPDRDHLDVLEMLDKGLKPLGFKHSATTQAGPNQYVVTFVSDE